VLSAAGRLVAAMLPQSGEPAMLAAAPAAAPLLAAPPADGAALSLSLQDTLAQSGLFYEAHQAEWVAGKHDLAQLRTEPQGRLVQSAPQFAADMDAAVTAATDSPGATTTAAPRAQQPLQAEATTLVQQQLAALESGKIVLQLEIWPRQWMQWEIEERAPQAAPEPETPPSWHTRLRLDLPQLGELNAALTLDGNGVQIKLDSISADSATLMQEHRAALHAALAAAGVPAAAIVIAHHDQP
jgi:flagellar hook-length control protein FliK